MTERKFVTIGSAEELTDRLVTIDDNPHLQERFYPRLMKLAGQELYGEGIVNALVLAVADYTEGQPPIMTTLMHMRLHQFIPAFTTNPLALADARAQLTAIGLPTR